MIRTLFIALAVSCLALPSVTAQKPKKQMYIPADPVNPKYKVDTRIDNMSYWRRMASLGLVPVQPDLKAPLGVYGTSKLVGRGVMTDDSPDIAVTTENSTQSENSIFVNPMNNEQVLQSNNSTPRPANTVYGANAFMSADAGLGWDGSIYGAGGGNSGDPSTAISLSGRYYVGYIHSSGGQGVSYSTDQGVTWSAVLVAPSPPGFGSMLDKNHMWIDNSPISPYSGYLYDAWTAFGGTNDVQIGISRSTDEGLTWSTPVYVSQSVNAGSHNQGVNLQTGPNGEVYALWAIYDNWPGDENCLAMAKSLDGGATWEPGYRILENIRGIRTTGTSKNMRVNSFPTMAVDISNGPNSGTIYVTWANTGVPGINTGNDKDVYLIKSTDQGTTWSSPVKVNQDAAGLGKTHFFPWITCDPINGNLSIVYYDDRNVSANQCEVYTSNSTDGGMTWWDLKVSDVSFTPQPIQGLASDYFGDYLGNHARGGWVYPVWTDNRLGYAMTYVSPFSMGPPPNQPWLVYDNHLINDATGNSNGLLDFGESATLNIGIKNFGDTPAVDVIATLSTESPYINITDNQATFGDIGLEEIVNINDAFAITVDNTIPDAEMITFTISATDENDSTYVSNFIIEAHSIAFRTGLISLAEVNGNGNGRLDPGESASIAITTINSGDYAANDVNVLLTSSSPYIVINNPTHSYPTLAPGSFNAVIPTFTIEASPDTPVGHIIDFNYSITSEYHQGSKLFNFPVGLIIEDWENNGFNSFDWEFAGSLPWSITNEEKFEGQYSAKSGAIGNNSNSELKLPYHVLNDDSISFYIKVSSEANYDFLKFYINNTQVGNWSGNIDWQRVSFPVEAGENTFRWVYSKDASDISGEDAAWVDYIVLPAEFRTILFAGPDGLSCERDSYLLSGSAINIVSLEWTTSGDGTFDNPTSLTPFYTPGAEDLGNQSVVLTLTGLDAQNQTIADNLTLTFSKQASLIPIDNITVCQGEEVNIEAIVSNYSSLLWSTSGTGTFTDPVSSTTQYIPSNDDYILGNVTLSITISSEAPCSGLNQDVNLILNPKPTATLSGDSSICLGETTTAQISLTGSAPWIIEMNNGIEIITTSDNPAIVTLSPESSTSYQVVKVTDNNLCYNEGTGAFAVTLNENPIVSITSDTTLCGGSSVTLQAETPGDVSYLWTPTNLTSSFITLDTTSLGIGTFQVSVLVTDIQTGCSSTAQTNVTFQDCTGLNEISSSGLMIYPNPTKGSFKVRLNTNDLNNCNLEIYDATNKLVYSLSNLNVTTTEDLIINTTNLKEGLYNLYLKGSAKSYSAKLIVVN